MSIKCRHCGGRHSKVETVRQCAIEAGVDLPKVERELWLPLFGPTEPVRHELGRPPAGYYWLDQNLVVKIRIPAEGRWKGRYFVVSYDRVEHTEKLVFEKKHRESFFKWLMDNPWRAYMHRYGTNAGYCPACGGLLTPTEKHLGRHDHVSGPYGNSCAEVVQGRYVIQGV